jgi:hypothetical protein
LDLEALVATAVAANDRSVRDQRVVDTRERHQVSLELVQVEAGAGNVQVATADIVHGLVVDQESTVRVLDGAVGGENSVVRLDDSSRNTGRRVNTELQLGLLAILSRELFQQEGTETRASTSTERVENKETLQARASIYCGLVYRS